MRVLMDSNTKSRTSLPVFKVKLKVKVKVKVKILSYENEITLFSPG